MSKNANGQDLDWLVIFLVYNNNYYDLNRQDTKEYYTMNEQTSYIRNQIRYTRFNKRVKTIFVEVKIENKKENDEIVKINASISMLYKKKGTWLSSVNGIWRRRTPQDALTSSVSLIKILSFLKKKYSAKKHMVITAGHGSITGINYYLPSKIESTRNEQTDKLLLQESNNSAFDKENPVAIPINDFTESLLFLSNKEINDAIKFVWGVKKIDVLVMYNCLMQNLFTQFEFKDTVEWLVAPLSGISIPGFNYGSVLDEINLNPEITGKEVSELFMNSVRAGNSYTLHKQDIEGTWKLAATQIDRTWLLEMQKGLENLFKSMNDSFEVEPYIISQLNSFSRFLFSYSFHCLATVQLLDVGSFLCSLMEEIKNDPGKETLIDTTNELLNVLTKKPQKQFVFEGDLFYNVSELTHYETTGTNYKNINNVSMFFPIEKPGGKIFDPVFDETIDNFKDLENPQFVSLQYKLLINKLHKLMPLDIG